DAADDAADDAHHGSIKRRRTRELVEEDADENLELDDPQRQKWLLYPGMSKSDMKSTSFPRLPRRTKLLQQPPAPIYLDLSRPTPQPILLAAGGVGGLGNPHFNSREHPRPVFATKGDEAVTIKIALELKLLADVGLVGLPNAGKSTLLRAITNSRTRVGSWAFTTLQPNIGTVVLDRYSGRPSVRTRRRHPAQPLDGPPSDVDAEPRTRFSVADIPGLVEGAHLDRGLGIAFLRHVERAGVLAFVIDLAAGNAVAALEALWREVGLYAQMRDDEERGREIESRVDWDLASDAAPGPVNLIDAGLAGPAPGEGPSPVLHIAGKPWFVVATKADLPGTQDNFGALKAYLDDVTAGRAPHPSGVDGAWTSSCAAIPVSAINGQGVDRIVHWTVGLLDE
ncbi:GTPase MTG2, mitochondrial, partial [Tolypocladium capitatum]